MPGRSCLGDLAWAHGPGPMGPGKISQARSSRQGVLGKVSNSSIGEKYAALVKICSIGEKQSAFAKSIQHLRKISCICETHANYCAFLHLFETSWKNWSEIARPSPSTAPAHKKYSGGTPKLKPGQARDTELNRVKKHHWSPSSIRYLEKNVFRN